jgi:16S rRNA (uracil1498-N3)-methyltransferase
MPAERYYYPHAINQNETIALTDGEHHHLQHVMRGKKGDHIEIVNGSGVLAEGSIAALEKKESRIHITDVAHTPKPPHRIILAQAIPRINRLDFIIEKGTELGMTDLWLFPGVRSERKSLSEHQLERFQAMAIAAMKQSGRLHLPSISIHPSLEEWQKPEAHLFYGAVSKDAQPFKHFWKNPAPPESLFFIGPESGFAPAEEHLLEQWKAAGVCLNSNILRTDTAAIAALTLLSHWTA